MPRERIPLGPEFVEAFRHVRDERLREERDTGDPFGYLPVEFGNPPLERLRVAGRDLLSLRLDEPLEAVLDGLESGRGEEVLL